MNKESLSFRCSRTGKSLQLRILRKQDSEMLLLEGRFVSAQDGTGKSESNVNEAADSIQELGQVRISASRLKGLASWIKKLDAKKCPDFELGAFGMVFRYQHFERGEVHYTVSFTTRETGTVTLDEYDQVGNSNEYRARKIRSAL